MGRDQPSRHHEKTDMSRIDTVQWGGDRLRVRPWRGDPAVAYIAVGPGHRPLDRTLDDCLRSLETDGFSHVLTAALSPTEQQVFLARGFTVHEHLHLLRHPLSAPIDAPARRPSRSAPRHPRGARRRPPGVRSVLAVRPRGARRRPTSHAERALPRDRQRRDRRLRGHRPGRHRQLPAAPGRPTRPAATRDGHARWCSTPCTGRNVGVPPPCWSTPRSPTGPRWPSTSISASSASPRGSTSWSCRCADTARLA